MTRDMSRKVKSTQATFIHFMCVYIYYTHTSVYIIYIYIYIYIYILHTRVCIYTYTHTHYTQMYVYIYSHSFILHTHTYIYFTHTYIYNTHTRREQLKYSYFKDISFLFIVNLLQVTELYLSGMAYRRRFRICFVWRYQKASETSKNV